MPSQAPPKMRCELLPAAAPPSVRRSPRRTRSQALVARPGAAQSVRDEAARPASGAISIAARALSTSSSISAAPQRHRRVAACSTSGLSRRRRRRATAMPRYYGGDGKRRVPVFCEQSADYKLRKGRAIGWANYNVIEEKRREEQRRKKIDQLLHKARCVNNAAEGQKILNELEKALEQTLAPTSSDEDIWSTCEEVTPGFRCSRTSAATGGDRHSERY